MDDFEFYAESEACSILPPEADPNPSSTTDSGETTMYPPSEFSYILSIFKNINFN